MTKMHYFIYPFCSIFIIVGAAILFDAVRGMVKAEPLKTGLPSMRS